MSVSESRSVPADDAWDATGGKVVTLVNDNTQTVGVCAQGSIGFIVYVSYSACVAVDRHMDVAVITSGDAGPPTASIASGPRFSDAKHVRDLTGEYNTAGGSGGEGPTFGMDATRGSDCSGRSVTSFYPSVGVGLKGLPGFETHGGTGLSGVLGTGPNSCSKPLDGC